MSTLYSARLFAATVLVSQLRVRAFTVPTGHAVVVRSVSLYAEPAAGWEFLLYLGAGGPEFYRAVPASNTKRYYEDVRITYHEGEACYVRAIVKDTTATLNGFVLTGGGAPLTPGTLPSP